MPTPPANSTTAVAPAPISQEAINEALRAAGMAEPENTSGINRVSMNGFMFTTAAGKIYTSNPKTNTPAMRVRLLDTPIEYQAAWLDENLARVIGRPGFSGFCKSYFKEPTQARRFAEDGSSCSTCQVGPFVKKELLPAEADGKRCGWKADILFQILDDEGTITDPTVHLLSMSITGVIEFKGTAKDPVTGSASDLNFNQKLVRFGMDHDKEDPQRGLATALTSLGMGLVIADVRLLPQSNEGGSRNWTVPSFTPVDIIAPEDVPALPAGEPAAQRDDLPF